MEPVTMRIGVNCGCAAGLAAERSLVVSAFALKIIASIAMLIDHTGQVFPAPATPELFRCIGRIAFPIYAFMAAQGCKHTGNINRYLLRLGAFALISEIPFDTALFASGESLESAFSQVHFLYRTNVFYTLFFGVACVAVYEGLQTKKRPWIALFPVLLIPASFPAYFLGGADILGYPLATLILQLAFLLCTACVLYLSRRLPETPEIPEGEEGRRPALPQKVVAFLPVLPLIYCGFIFASDYSAFGVAFIFILYLACPENRITRAIAAALGIAFLYGPGVLWRTPDGAGAAINANGLLYLVFALASVILLSFYMGRQGRKIKWAFY
jgi:hypothetical protein